MLVYTFKNASNLMCDTVVILFQNGKMALYTRKGALRLEKIWRRKAKAFSAQMTGSAKREQLTLFLL